MDKSSLTSPKDMILGLYPQEDYEKRVQVEIENVDNVPSNLMGPKKMVPLTLLKGYRASFD